MCRNKTYSCIVRFKAIGDWTPLNTSWCRAWVSCQNKVANGKYSVTGSIILISDAGKMYLGYVTGGVSGYSELSITWNNYYTEKEIMNKIGALFNQYGTLYVSSQLNSPSSLEGSQINFYGMGGNSGDSIYLDGYNNHFRIVSKFGSNTLTVYEFTKDGIHKNGVKICG